MDRNTNGNGIENIVLAGIFAIPALPAAVVAGIWYWAISVLRITSVLIGGVIAVSAIPFVINFQIGTYLLGWITLCFGVESTFYPGQVTWLKVILTSIPAGLIAGGFLYFLRRPNVLERRKKPEETKANALLNRKFSELIEKRIEKKPAKGVFLGIDRDSRKPVIISELELNQHTFLVGTTGSGKTTTLKNYLDFAFKKGFSVVIIDGKGEWSYVQEIRTMAEAENKRFQVFSLNHPDQSHHYNPLVTGNPTELKDRLISCFDWTEPHYMLGASRYLQLAFQILRASGERIDLPMLVQNLNPDILFAVARQVGAPNSVLQGLDEIDEKTKAGIISRLAILAESSIGDLLEANSREINLLNSIRSGGVAMFSLDKLTYPTFARQLGIIITNDLKACAAQCGGQSHKTMLIFDEFNTFATPQVVDLVNATRSFGFCAVMATQSLADLDRVDTSIRRQIIGNVNTVIVQRQNDSQDAELLAATIGTRDSIQLTQQIEDYTETALGSMRETKEFIVHPDQIKRLKTGEAIILRKYPEFRVQRINRIRNVS